MIKKIIITLCILFSAVFSLSAVEEVHPVKIITNETSAVFAYALDNLSLFSFFMIRNITNGEIPVFLSVHNAVLKFPLMDCNPEHYIITERIFMIRITADYIMK